MINKEIAESAIILFSRKGACNNETGSTVVLCESCILKQYPFDCWKKIHPHCRDKENYPKAYRILKKWIEENKEELFKELIRTKIKKYYYIF